MGVILYWLGFILVAIFCVNFFNVFSSSLIKLNEGKATAEEKGLVFSFLLGIIGYLLMKLMG